MRINLDLTHEQTLSLMVEADKAKLTVDEYIYNALFGNSPSPLSLDSSILDLENKLHTVIEACKDKIVKYEKGFVFVTTDIIPYSRQLISKEETEVITREVISWLEVNKIISLYSNASQPFQYIRN